eukprot:TRINITY_DN11341_c0_g1_i5.p1 TRINITY_DN11341_c0_g1~~TRINITY_DN11341_c0_g1_i5.p1  ORF type:complete len:308 (+),score=62.34 TRINITY_DN11341_c0_g1_i5:29-952(+)
MFLEHKEEDISREPTSEENEALFLGRIMRDNLQTKKPFLFLISRSSIAALSLLDFDISSCLMDIFKTEFDKGSKIFQQLCLSAVKNVAQVNPSLVKEVQLTYHRLARSSSETDKSVAMEIAVAAASCSFDYFGYGEVFVPSLDYAECLLYYRREISLWISLEIQQADVLKVICEFSSETYRPGQLIDAQDSRLHWCAAEITEVEHHRIHILYTGWKQCEEWIELPSQRVAPAFTFTKVVPGGPGNEQHELYELHRNKVKSLAECEILGLESEDMARTLFLQFSSHHVLQFMINHARWINRDKLMHIL